MAIQGLRSTVDHAAGEAPESWQEGILLNEPNGDATLYALSSMMKKRTVKSSIFHWFEEDLPAHRFKLTANLTVTNNFKVQADGLYLKEGDILLVEETQEQVIITVDPTNDTALTVQRGFAGTTATAVPVDGNGVNPYVLLLASAYEEGSVAPAGRSYNPVEKSNYIQIHRDTLEITDSDMVEELRTGSVLAEDKRRALHKHSLGIERMAAFSQKSVSTYNGKPRRTSAGIVSQIDPANIKTPAAGGLSMSEFEKWSEDLFRYGSTEKFMLMGNRTATGLTQMARYNSDYEFMGNEKEHGMSVRRFRTPHGTLVTKTWAMFNQIRSGTTGTGSYNAMDTWGLVLDFEYLKYVTLKGRDTKFETDLEIPGTDGKKAGYITKNAFQVSNSKAHALFKGITSGVKDV